MPCTALHFIGYIFLDQTIIMVNCFRLGFLSDMPDKNTNIIPPMSSIALEHTDNESYTKALNPKRNDQSSPTGGRNNIKISKITPLSAGEWGEWNIIIYSPLQDPSTSLNSHEKLYYITSKQLYKRDANNRVSAQCYRIPNDWDRKAPRKARRAHKHWTKTSQPSLPCQGSANTPMSYLTLCCYPTLSTS